MPSPSSEFQLDTPVAFFIFNRPECTQQVFSAISKAKPKILLLISDGPRPSRENEDEKVAKTRSIVEKIDWPCTVLKNYSETNLGCKKRISSGIDWVFTHVSEAIFLEDDCLPDPSFFRFCQEMLEKYRDNPLVGMISGDNFQFGRRTCSESYYFSKYFHIWGWATWRDRWEDYDVDMKKWPEIKKSDALTKNVKNKKEKQYWSNVFQQTYAQRIDTWDHQWTFANWITGRLCILPNVNLISNLGFSLDATHTKSYGKLADLPTTAIEFPLVHPVSVQQDEDADHFSDQQCIRQPLWEKIKGRLAVLFKRKN